MKQKKRTFLKSLKEYRKFIKENVETAPAPVKKPDTKPAEPVRKPTPFRPPKRKEESNPKPKALMILEAIKYDSGEKMHPEVQKSFEEQTHPLAKNPAYPEEMFDELMASKRFRDVIEKLKRYAKIKDKVVTLNDITQLMQSVYYKIIDIEKDHKDELKDLAVELIMKEFGIEPGDIDFDADLDDVDLSEIQPNKEEPTEQDIEKLVTLDMEVEKRKFVNSLIQGSAVKMGYMFHLIEDKLNEIYPDLANMYGLISAITEYGYWMVPDELATAMSQDSAVGKVKVDLSKDVPEVKASSTIFPLLIHELAKGVTEVLLSHDKLSEEDRKYVISKADTLDNEHSALRIGPAFWEKLNETIYDAGLESERNHIISYLSSLPAEEFNKSMKKILSNDAETAKKEVKMLSEGEL